MKPMTTALEEAAFSLHRLGIPAVLPALHDAGIRIRRTVLGGSHSVAIYPPIDSLTPLDPLRVADTIDCGRDVSLYVHIAFCETRCTFCHYAVDHYAGPGRSPEGANDDVSRYLQALRQELVSWGAELARAGTAVSSIYVGGGTPLILDEPALFGIIGTIQEEYDVLPGAELCMEGSPLTITAPGGEDKLRNLQARGVTRLSFGVQSFDDTVLKYAARGYKRDVAVRAAVIAGSVFENWNIDLIQGLYRGSPHETWRNLEVIADIHPPHLTWYHGRFADRPQGEWYNSGAKHACFEDEPATLLGRMLIWRELAALGYHQTDGNRFVLEQQYTDPFKKIRTSAGSNLLGVGAASYSHVGSNAASEDCRGYVLRNRRDIRDYVDGVLSGCSPIAGGRVVDDDELFAASYATGLRKGRIEDEGLRAIRNRKPELASHYDSLSAQLREIGILEPFLDDDGEAGWRISELGRLFEDETLALFFSPAVQRALAMRVAR